MATTIPPPSRAEFDRAMDRIDRLSQHLSDVQRELSIQFDRMAQLQADIDLIRAAWTKSLLQSHAADD